MCHRIVPPLYPHTKVLLSGAPIAAFIEKKQITLEGDIPAPLGCAPSKATLKMMARRVGFSPPPPFPT